MQYQNPILSGFHPDPSICRVGKDFYLVTSSFEYFPGIPIFHSRDLVHWEQIGHCLTRNSQVHLVTGAPNCLNIYAPTIRYHEGTFYVVVTNVTGDNHGNFIVTATDPAGEWSEPIPLPFAGIDPSLFFDDDGKVYYLGTDGGIYLSQLDIATGEAIGETHALWQGTANNPEGPHLYKINGMYYLLLAQGGTELCHMAVLARSKSILGPYEPCPHNPILTNIGKNLPIKAAGPADLVDDADGNWWAVCLGIRPVNGKYQHLGRETFLAPVTWDADGWPKVGKDGVVQETYLFPNLPSHVWMEQPVRDDFDQETLGLDWTFIRNPAHSFWSLTEKPGSLRLKGTAINFTTNDSPSFIGRRQAAFNLTASAKVNFIPKVENEEAGLVVRADDKNHYDLLITERNGQRVAMIRKTLKDKVVDTTCKELPATGEVILSITATETTYTFEIKAAHVSAILGTASTRDVSNEVVGGFTGVFIGMYASGNGQANTNPADFDWFDFRCLD